MACFGWLRVNAWRPGRRWWWWWWCHRLGWCSTHKHTLPAYPRCTHTHTHTQTQTLHTQTLPCIPKRSPTQLIMTCCMLWKDRGTAYISCSIYTRLVCTRRSASSISWCSPSLGPSPRCSQVGGGGWLVGWFVCKAAQGAPLQSDVDGVRRSFSLRT